MEIDKENGLLFNYTKFSIKIKSVNFFGGIYDENGVHPDPPKVGDIKTLKSPTNEAELQHILRMLTYMGPFKPLLLEYTTKLCDLKKKKKKRTTNMHGRRSARRPSSKPRLLSAKN